MNIKSFATIVIMMSILFACGEDKSSRKSDRDANANSSDLIKLEAEVSRSLPLFTAVETYNEDGELVRTKELFYDLIPLNPSYEERNSEGKVVEKVEIATNEQGFILQRKTTIFEDDTEIVKIEDFERDENGNVINLTVDNNGQYRRTEFLLSDFGKEIRSQVFNSSDELLSEREVDWENSEITFYAYDGAGKPTLKWSYIYLKLEMKEGVLSPIFNVSQERDVLVEEADSTRIDGKCVVESSPIKCEQSFVEGLDVTTEKISSSFYVVPFNNGFYKYHEVLDLEVLEKKFAAEKLKSELTTKRRYGDQFQLKSVVTNERIIGSSTTESELLLFYDNEGRIQIEEYRQDGSFQYKKVYGY